MCKIIKCSCGIIVGQFVDHTNNKTVLKDELKRYTPVYNEECAKDEFNFVIPLTDNYVCCKYCYRKRRTT